MPQMFQVYQAVKNHDPVLIAARSNGQIKGVLLAVVKREGGIILGKVSARSIIWGGPLVQHNEPQIFFEMMRAYNRIASKIAVYSQFRNLNSVEWEKSGWKNLGYHFEDHLNILIDLTQSSSALWKKLHPTRRKQIERGYRRGAEFRFIINSDDQTIKSCHRLITSVYKKIRLPCPGEDFFIAANRFLGERLGLFMLFFKERLIACRFVLMHNQRMYDWYAGADSTQMDKYPNDILSWEAMKWGIEHHYEIFDFGGAGKPGVPYGVRDFKLKYGGDLVNFGRVQMVHRPILMQAAKGGLRLWKYIKG